MDSTNSNSSNGSSSGSPDSPNLRDMHIIRGLLRRPIEERLQYFQSKVVAHPRLIETHERLLQLVRQPTGASLILVYGPTGVGKTTMRLRVEQKLIEDAQALLAKDPSHVPIVSAEAATADSGHFSWKDMYRRMLLALEEPAAFVNQQRRAEASAAASTDAADTRFIHQRNFNRARAVADLRWSIEQAVHHRRPMALVIDEAQHLNRVAGGRTLLNQMDNLKSLASTTNTVIVLIGTYELLSMSNLSAQLARRSVDIHFPRYLASDDHDMTEFENVLFTFQHHLPVVKMPDLVRHSGYVYEGCAGCIGTLKEWLNRTLALALAQDAKTITFKHLEQCVDVHKQIQIAREISEGEKVLGAWPHQRDVLRALLGIDITTPALSTTPAPVATTTATTGNSQKSKRPLPLTDANVTNSVGTEAPSPTQRLRQGPRPSVRRIGRKPMRDPVESPSHEAPKA